MSPAHPPVLLYHKVDPRWETGVTWVTPEQFKHQLQAVSQAGWQSIPLSGSGDSRDFSIVFDDGYESIFHNAYPVLETLGYKATVFMPSGFVGKWNSWDHNLLGRRFRHLSQELLKELVSAGWAVGSHGISHRSMLNLNAKSLRDELTDSRKALEDLLGASVNLVAFPFGRYDARVLDAAVEAGYVGAVVPVRITNVAEAADISIHQADCVYRWDGAKSVLGLLSRGQGYGLSRLVRYCANQLSGGTIIWRSVFRRQFPLAK